MSRELINENDTGRVVGGSIFFNDDCTTCGRNCTDQYRVLNLDAVVQYVNANCTTMSERTMLNNMVAAGYLANM